MEAGAWLCLVYTIALRISRDKETCGGILMQSALDALPAAEPSFSQKSVSGRTGPALEMFPSANPTGPIIIEGTVAVRTVGPSMCYSVKRLDSSHIFFV
jgi:hypothetical protein